MGSVSNYQTALEGVLVNQISAAATTATVKVKEINGATPTWLTTAHRLTIIQKTRTVTKVEVVDVASGTTQSGSTVTLGTLTRGLPLDGTGFTGTGTPQVFSSGAKVILTWDAQAGRQTMFKDAVNTLTGSGAIRSTSTTTPAFRPNSVTTAQRNAMTPGNGDAVYDSDLNQMYDYVGGAWVARAAGSFSDAENGVAGKVDLATAAEVAAGTTDDATSGGPNVIPVSIVKTSSTGAVNGTVPALNAAVALDASIGGTGRTSVTTGALLVGAGTSAMTIIGPGTVGQVPVSDGTTIAMGVSSPLRSAIIADPSQPTDTTYVNFVTYSSAASDIAAGTVYRFTGHGTYDGGTSARQPGIAIRIGSTAVLEISPGTNPTASTVFPWRFEGEFVCRSTGAGSAVVQATGTFFLPIAAGAERAFFASTSTTTIDTTAINTLALSGKLSASGTGTSFLAKNAYISKLLTA